MHLSKSINKKASLEFIRFFVSGVTAFLVDLTILNLMIFIIFDGGDKFLFGFELISISKFTAAAVGLTISFILNRNWAFNALYGNIYTQIGKFVFITLLNLLFATILYSIFFNILKSSDLSLKLTITFSNILTEAVKMLTTYLFYKFFVFK